MTSDVNTATSVFTTVFIFVAVSKAEFLYSVKNFVLGFNTFSTITVLRTGSGCIGDLGLELQLLLLQLAT